ncbi:hypothetical protein [Lacipirellula parvula]|uniref:Uncharacterized protein n=1 Tax=Lacipirellula parvula TaxID=2650471 RepID=A0A5K7XF05_9BACT|nr:hypothetical protein [Lacipirellula parvula]BBO34582.1 hypothetical protein PLANPX_4194 [Lacipirellula parvula]
MKCIRFRPPAEGQPTPTIDIPYHDFLVEKLDTHWTLTPHEREQVLKLLPLIVWDCVNATDEWPAYMPNLGEEFTMFPNHPWMRSMMGALAFEVLTKAALFAQYPDQSPFTPAEVEAASWGRLQGKVPKSA